MCFYGLRVIYTVFGPCAARCNARFFTTLRANRTFCCHCSSELHFSPVRKRKHAAMRGVWGMRSQAGPHSGHAGHAVIGRSACGTCGHRRVRMRDMRSQVDPHAGHAVTGGACGSRRFNETVCGDKRSRSNPTEVKNIL